MIRLAGLRPDKDVEIAFTGMRPGEKLYEELFHDTEPMIDVGWQGLFLAAARTADLEVLRKAVEHVEAAARAGRVEEVLKLLRHHVPEFTRSAPAGPPRAPAPDPGAGYADASGNGSQA
jgi:O-antigen biosynthesis protein WbqV